MNHHGSSVLRFRAESMLQLLKRTADKFSNSWFEHFGQASLTAPTWALDKAALNQCVVYWPTHYEWPPSSVFLDSVRLGIAHWARVERRAIAQPYQGVAIFEVVLGGGRRPHRVAVDYSDYVDRIERDCLANVSLYFKMQCLKAGYQMTDQERNKFFAGGYVTADRRLTPQLAAIRAAGRKAEPEFKVYGRFGREFAKDIRTSVVELLKSDAALSYAGGMKKVKYRQSVLEAARSKICIDLPGNGDFCFRLLDYLSIGAFIIAYPHRTKLLSPLIDRQHIVYMKPDLSDLLELCHYYLQRDEERRTIQDNAAQFFDSYCNYMQTASWYLHHCLRLLPADD